MQGRMVRSAPNLDLSRRRARSFVGDKMGGNLARKDVVSPSLP